MSIKYKLVISFFLLIIIPFVLLSTFFTYYTQNVLREKIISSHKEVTKQIGININSILDNMAAASMLVVADKNMGDILSKDIYDDMTSVFSNLKYINNSFLDILYSVLKYQGSFIAIKDSNSNIHISFSTPVEKAKVKDFIDQNSSNLSNYDIKWFGVTDKYLDNAYLSNHMVTILRKIPSDLPNQNNGVMLIGVNENVFYNVIESNSAESDIKVYIIDENGIIISSTVREEVNSIFNHPEVMEGIKGKPVASIDLRVNNQIINTYPLTNGRWKVIEIIPYKVIYKDINHVRNVFFFTGGICILLFILIAFFIANRLTKPMICLTNAMQKAQEGDMSVQVSIGGRDEIGKLSNAFNTMICKIRELIIRINEEEQVKRSAELKMLRAQINPHFLFNTLNSIRWVAEMNRAKPVSELILALASLLKNSIMNDKEFVSLAEEIDNLKNYCKIQEVRYGGIFEVRYNVAKEALDCLVINLMLQPIVENSLIHGFEGLSRKGEININAEIMDEHLVITVIDNGQGMDQEQIKRVLEKRQDKHGELGSIGIINIHDRLKINFGREYGLEMFGEVGQGIKTVIRIPLSIQKE